MPVKAGYSYFKEVTVNHTDDAAQNLYQMKVLVGESSGSGANDVHCEGHCLSTFNDLWFTGLDADGSTVVDLDYWIESISGTTPNQVATVWVEVHYIPAHPNNTTVWMSYGKAGAAAASNGANTFIIFNSGSTVTGWTVKNISGTVSWSSSGGKIRGDETLGGVGGLYCDTQTGVNSYKLCAMIQNSTGLTTKNDQIGLMIRTSQASDQKGYQRWLDVLNKWDSADEAGGSDLSSVDDTFDARDPHEYLVNRESTGGTTKLYVDGSLKVTHTKASWNPQYIALMLYGAEEANMYCDFWNIFVANNTVNEPTFGAWGAEQSTLIRSVPRIARIMVMSP